jgi:hypothetical protein
VESVHHTGIGSIEAEIRIDDCPCALLERQHPTELALPGDIPEASSAIAADREDAAVVSRERRVPHFGRVTGKTMQTSPALQIPEVRCFVSSSRHRQPSIV